MENGKIRILAVDDEIINLEILEDDLSLAGYEVICAENGQVAWDTLAKHPDIKVILLDRMMPVMGGMELIEKLKAHDSYKHIPVIMQTGAAVTEQVKEGVEAGVYYYLTKPFNEDILLAIVAAAVDDIQKADALQAEVQKMETNISYLKSGLQHVQRSVFEFYTLEDVKSIAFILANSCPEPSKAVLGITEIMQNAIEHGNLGISFEEKSDLLVKGLFVNEIQSRLDSPEYKTKKATVELTRNGKDLEITVTDEGKGFNWKEYLEIAPERATCPNGRGIIMASKVSFNSLEFVGSGNQVICRIALQ